MGFCNILLLMSSSFEMSCILICFSFIFVSCILLLYVTNTATQSPKDRLSQMKNLGMWRFALLVIHFIKLEEWFSTRFPNVRQLMVSGAMVMEWIIDGYGAMA